MAENHVEIERKYLIDLPGEELLDRSASARWEIVQIYLENKDATERVRQVTENGAARYYHTEKRQISAMSNFEAEREITEAEYKMYLCCADPALKPIHKTRWRIPCCGHVLEIDRYPFWEKTAVLEIEFESEDETAELPAWITIRKEVTGDYRYKNVALAREVPEVE